MSENVGGTVAKIGERFMEGVPGFALVALVVGLVLPFALPPSEAPAHPRDAIEVVRQSLPVVAVVIAWLAYFLGHYLDDVIFDPVWGVRTRAATAGRQRPALFERALRRIPGVKQLEVSREKLAKRWKRPLTGTFAKAQDLTARTEVWEKKIKWPLEWSKACRSFVILGLIVLALQLEWRQTFGAFVVALVFWLIPGKPRWRAFKNLIFGVLLTGLAVVSVLKTWAAEILPRLEHPLIAVAAALLCAAGYIGLRVLHLLKLYEECVKVEFDAGEQWFSTSSKVVKARKVLLYAVDVHEEMFRDAELFIQSEALLHVDVRSLYPARSEPDRERLKRPYLKEDRVKKLCLYENQLRDEKVVTLDDETVTRREFNQLHDVAIDLLIEFKKGDAPPGAGLKELRRYLNGIL
jgi:hypothetical protein